MDREPAARSRVDRIIALYQAGDTARAADELRALRVEDPDAESNLPESLREWARSVR
jgi:anti-sigma factor ChrR (cupin superfamily)